MPGTHAKWSPSGSPFWFNDGKGCPARVLLPPKPETPSPAATEGTRLHDLAEAYLTGQDPAMTGEDFRKLDPYICYVDARMFNPNVNVTIEEQVRLEPITGEDGATGTVDALVCSDDYLEVIDLKTGAKRVAPTSNQLKMYAAAAVHELDYTGEEVICTIVQGDVPSSVIYRTEEVLKFGDTIHTYVYQSEADADAGELRYEPSEENCQWCPHVIDCAAQAAMRDEVAAKDFAVSEDPGELAADLEMCGALERWCSEVRSRALKVASAGTRLPGFKLVHARANRRWTETAEEELVALLGDAAYDRKLIGVTAGDKLVDAEDMSRLTIKPVGKPTLAPETDPRPAIDDAATDFKDD